MGHNPNTYTQCILSTRTLENLRPTTPSSSLRLHSTLSFSSASYASFPQDLLISSSELVSLCALLPLVHAFSAPLETSAFVYPARTHSLALLLAQSTHL